jgi:hypothetical protein
MAEFPRKIQPQSGTLGLGGEERLEQMLHDLARDARGPSSSTDNSTSKVRRGRPPDPDRAGGRRRVAQRIAQQVHHHLTQVVEIEHEGCRIQRSTGDARGIGARRLDELAHDRRQQAVGRQRVDPRRLTPQMDITSSTIRSIRSVLASTMPLRPR